MNVHGKPRRLCLLCEATAGGVRKHVMELLRFFCRPEEGFEVHALFGDRGEPGFIAEAARLRAAGAHTEIVSSFTRSLNPLNDFQTYRLLEKRLREIKPDIVHTHSAKAGFLGRLAAHAVGVPFIFHTAHVFPFQWATGATRRFYLTLERFAATRCRRIICVGKGQYEEALRVKLTGPEKPTVILNGVTLPPLPTDEDRAEARRRLKLPPDVVVIGMVARLAPQKGLNLFMDAAEILARRDPRAVFLLIGDGPLREEVGARVAGAGNLATRFRLLGYREDVERIYPALDALALSSLYEGLPYVLLEAQAWGVPVAATDVLGSREVVAEGETGFLIPPRRDAAPLLAERLARLLNDAELRRRCGAAARERVARLFSAEAFFAAHRRLYRGEEP